MSPKKLMKSFALCQDMINVFTDYADKLDVYFSDVDNCYKHNDLHNYYLELKKSLQDVSIKNGFVK